MEMNTETIITIVLAALSSGLVSSVLVKLIDVHHENAVKKYEKKEKKLEKAEQIKLMYIINNYMKRIRIYFRQNMQNTT